MGVFLNVPRIVSGPGAADNLCAEVLRLGGSKVLLVTDPGLVKTGIVDGLEKGLAAGGVEVLRFDRVEADPRYEIAAEAAEKARESGVNCILGVGGGSSLDVAKMASIMFTNPMPIEKMFGIDQVPEPGLPLILVPTTAGTGSEVTHIAILSDEHEKLKKGVVSSHLIARTAILDPLLCVGLPPAVTAATGCDALIHAVEAYTSKNATGISDMYAREAIQLIAGNIRTAYANGENLKARTAMLEGSLLAGLAFANAGVTAVHAFAYPIGAEFHIPHGVANTIMLVPVMEYNIVGNLSRFAELADLLGENTNGCTLREKAGKTVSALVSIAEDLEVSRHLRDFGVKEEDVPALAEGAMKVTRLLANNPRKMTLQAAESIYRAAL